MLLEQIGCRQNQLRRIGKKILWVKVSSDQLTQQNPHQELPGSGSLCYTAPEQKDLMRRKRDTIHTTMTFWFFSNEYNGGCMRVDLEIFITKHRPFVEWWEDKKKILEKFLFPISGEGMMKSYGNIGKTSRQFHGFIFTVVLEMVLITEMDYNFCT